MAGTQVDRQGLSALRHCQLEGMGDKQQCLYHLVHLQLVCDTVGWSMFPDMPGLWRCHISEKLFWIHVFWPASQFTSKHTELKHCVIGFLHNPTHAHQQLQLHSHELSNQWSIALTLAVESNTLNSTLQFIPAQSM